MSRAIFLLLAAAGSAHALQDKAEEEAYLKGYTPFQEGRRTEARAPLQEFIRRYSNSSHVPEALLALSRCYGDAPDERAAEMECLRRLNNDFPKSPQAGQGQNRVMQIAGWTFSTLPALVRPDPQSQVLVTRHHYDPTRFKHAPESRFVLYHIDHRVYREAVERMWREQKEEPDLPRDMWRRVDEHRVEFSGGQQLESQTISFNVKESGFYLAEEKIEGFRKVHSLSVANFGIAVKSLQDKTIVFAVDPWSGSPLDSIRLWARTADRTLEGLTNKDGMATFEGKGLRGILAERGSVVQHVPLSSEERKPDSLVYITTDRPIYRPGQTVRYKAVWRDEKDGALSFRAGEKVRVEIRDPQGRVLQGQEQAWNEAGSLSGSFRLGDEPPLGDYRVVVHIVEPRDYTYVVDEGDDSQRFWGKKFRVAAYRKPEVHVSVEFPDPSPVGTGKIKARIRGEYYFGGPAAGAKVSWKASQEVRSADTEWPRAPFEDPRAWFYLREYEETNSFGSWSWTMDEVAKGEGITGADGTLEVEFIPKEEAVLSKYKVEAEVTDLSRLEANGEGEVAVHPAALRVSVGAPRMFYRPGDRMQARVRVTRPDGSPAADRAVELSGMLALPGPQKGELEFEPFFVGTSRSDASGLVVFDLSVPEAGRIRLRARARDDAGRAALDRADLWVAGETVNVAEKPADITLLPDRLVYEDGERAQFMVRSPQRKLTAFLVLEGRSFYEARIVHLERTCEVLEIPIKAEYGPNVFVKLHAWKDGAPLGGGFEVFVYPKGRFVDLGITTDKSVYGPGQKAKIRITAETDGKPVPAEFEIGVVDESIFAIQQDRTEDIRTFFHRLLDPNSLSASSCGLSDSTDSYLRRFYPQVATAAVAFDGRRGGAPLTGATFNLEESKVASDALAVTRSFFPDTVLWLAHARTGQDGRAEVELDMPGSLTTWRITVRAVSGRDRFGVASSRTLSRKDVILRVSAPRFFTERDQAIVSTILHNDLAADTEFKLRLAAEGLEAESGERRVKVASHGVARLDWKVRATKSGTAKIKAEALSPAESDAMEIEIPVRPHGLVQQMVKSGRVEGAWNETISLPADAALDTASLELSVTAPGVGAILEALPYLAGYPYGCVEQTMSRFLPSLIAARALRRLGVPNAALEKVLPDMVDKGLQRLYGFQHDDGGWGWWKHDETHPAMTPYVVYGLLTAKEAGFAVDERTLTRGLDCLKAMKVTPFALYVSKVGGREVDLKAEPTDPEGSAWLVLAGRRELARDLFPQPPKGSGPDELRAVALALRAITSVDPADPRIARLTDWLMLQRRGGAWISTLDTAWIVTALTDRAVVEKEPVVGVRVNGRDVTLREGHAALAGSLLRLGDNRIEASHRDGSPAYISAVLRFYTTSETLAPSSGTEIVLSRRFERAVHGKNERKWEFLETGSEVTSADEIRVVLSLRAPHGAEFVMIESPLPAGTEAREDEPDDYDWWQSWYARREMRDDRVCVAAEHLHDEAREFTFRLRPTSPGEYHVMPARAYAMYDPSRQGSSGEFLLRVVDR
jgi:uncharacterized protein YfaS (alpha-2-macroglobulin family)